MNTQCKHEGNLYLHHCRLCRHRREDPSAFCDDCTCGRWLRQSYPGPTSSICTAGSCLSWLFAADIEQCLALQPTVKPNTPFATASLAGRLQSKDTCAAIYTLLPGPCQSITHLRPQSVNTVGKDLSRQWMARAAGLLAIMVGMGVALPRLSATASLRVPAAP
jgi:hypothetical protein